MNCTQMCASCIHESYCMAAYKKDHWCGNHMNNKKLYINDSGGHMEDKENIVKRLKLLLIATRAGSNIEDMILNEKQNEITIIFKAGGKRVVDIAGDSGYAIIHDVMNAI